MRKIEDALASDDPEVRLEGEVASFLLRSGIDVAELQRGVGRNNSVGEIDAETDKAIVEATVARQGKLAQIQKYLGNPQLNPTGKTPVLYAEEYLSTAAADVRAAGGQVARSPQELLDVMRRLGH